MISTRAFAAAAAWLAFTGQAAPPPGGGGQCRLVAPVAIGCTGDEFDGAENAAAAYTRFGVDADRLRQPATKSYLNRFGCVFIGDKVGGLRFDRIGSRYVAEPDAEVNVLYVTAKSDPYKRMLWVAEPYFAGQCRPSSVNGQPHG